MNDCMLDLETLGTKPGCVILSIGAVMFDASTGEVGTSFYKVISLEDSVACGFKTEDATIAWWKRQSTEAQRVLEEARGNFSLPAKRVLANFLYWLGDSASNLATVRVWGNGADFDNAILAAAYDICGLEKPWGHYGAWCYRTLKNLLPDVKLSRTELAHHALEDAKYQARHAILLLRTLRGAVESQTLEGNALVDPHQIKYRNAITGIGPQILTKLSDSFAQVEIAANQWNMLKSGQESTEKFVVRMTDDVELQQQIAKMMDSK